MRDRVVMGELGRVGSQPIESVSLAVRKEAHPPWVHADALAAPPADWPHERVPGEDP